MLALCLYVQSRLFGNNIIANYLNPELILQGFLFTGCSVVRYRATFGTWRPLVRIQLSRQKFPLLKTLIIIIRPFSSVVEQLTVNQLVVGSNPTGASEVGGNNFQCCSIVDGVILKHKQTKRKK